MSVLDIVTEENFHQTLGSKLWRLNNLYYIHDKNSNLVKLVLNKLQYMLLTVYKHPKKLILKSRQIGITTLMCAYEFDDCLFKPRFKAGIQSYGQDESAKLQEKIDIMWKNLDSVLIEVLRIKILKNNSNGIQFSNGSILRIGNFRGDTLQALHVSELAKISSKYPAKARELKTGAFQAVGKDNKITVESTSEGNFGLFFEMWTTYSAMVDAGIPLTPMDFMPIFLPWFMDEDCSMVTEVVLEPTELFKTYLVDLGKEFSLTLPLIYAEYNTTNSLPSLTLTIEQTNWLIVKLRELGADFNREYPATPDMAFAQSVEGTYFKVQYDILKEEKRFVDIDYNSQYPVYVGWDLGVNDENILLFWQVINGVVILVDEHHATGEGLPYFDKVLKNKKAQHNFTFYSEHILPHDIAVQEWGTGRTRIETMAEYGYTNINLLTRLVFAESIAVARQFLLSNIVISKRCVGTISALQNYKKKKDEKLGAYLDTDVHDIHSNYMAAFRYSAQGLSKYLVQNTEPNQKSNIIQPKGIAL